MAKATPALIVQIKRSKRSIIATSNATNIIADCRNRRLHEILFWVFHLRLFHQSRRAMVGSPMFGEICFDGKRHRPILLGSPVNA